MLTGARSAGTKVWTKKRWHWPVLLLIIMGYVRSIMISIMLFTVIANGVNTLEDFTCCERKDTWERDWSDWWRGLADELFFLGLLFFSFYFITPVVGHDPAYGRKATILEWVFHILQIPCHYEYRKIFSSLPLFNYCNSCSSKQKISSLECEQSTVMLREEKSLWTVNMKKKKLWINWVWCKDSFEVHC